MNKIIVNDHTIDKDLLTGGYVLDIGSRNYGFSNAMVKLGCNVIAVEPDDCVPLPIEKHIKLVRAAIVSSRKEPQYLAKWGNGEGNRLVSLPGSTPEGAVIQSVKTKTIVQLCNELDIHHWDVVKLDCEGCEYQILKEWPGPIATQITVEFHDFTGANPNGEQTYKEIFTHLEQWYDIVQHEKTERFAAKVTNYWDSLLVLK